MHHPNWQGHPCNHDNIRIGCTTQTDRCTHVLMLTSISDIPWKPTGTLICSSYTTENDKYESIILESNKPARVPIHQVYILHGTCFMFIGFDLIKLELPRHHTLSLSLTISLCLSLSLSLSKIIYCNIIRKRNSYMVVNIQRSKVVTVTIRLVLPITKKVSPPKERDINNRFSHW